MGEKEKNFKTSLLALLEKHGQFCVCKINSEYQEEIYMIAYRNDVLDEQVLEMQEVGVLPEEVIAFLKRQLEYLLGNGG